MQLNALNNEEQALYLWAFLLCFSVAVHFLLQCVLVFWCLFSIAVHCVLALRCTLSIVILSVMLSPKHLQSYYQYTLICSVCIQRLQLLRSSLWQRSVVCPLREQHGCSFTVWLAERSVSIIKSILISFHWMSFSVTGAHVLCCLNFICLSLCWGGGSWLGCGYCWPWGWFHLAGVELLANHRFVLGTWPPLTMNVVNFHKTVLIQICFHSLSLRSFEFKLVHLSETGLQTRVSFFNNLKNCIIMCHF